MGGPYEPPELSAVPALHKPLVRRDLPFFHETAAGMSERDEEVSGLYDAANEVDECAAWDDYRLRLEEEREELLEEALDACLKAGVSKEHLRVLVFETGAVSWGLKQSLKVEPKREKSWFSDGSF